MILQAIVCLKKRPSNKEIIHKINNKLVSIFPYLHLNISEEKINH